MTRVEAEKKVHSIFLNYLPFDGDKEADEVIKVLENEYFYTLDDVREDFMFDVYNILDFLPTNNEVNQIIDVFDRVTSGLKPELVLDKIYTDIQELRSCSYSCSDGIIDDVEEIIDKYKTRSEDKK